MAQTTEKIDFVRPEVADRMAAYKLIGDCLEGEEAIKKAKTLYLPMPNPDDDSDANKKRYAAYLTRAQFYNVAQRTWRGLVGQAFQKDLVIEVDSLLEGLLTSVDGTDTTLEQQARRADGELLGKGRVGLLADFPRTEKPVSRAEMNAGKVSPTITLYTTEQIINWRLVRVGSRLVLTKLWLSETAEIDDGAALTYEPRWRKFELIDGKCHVTLYKAAEDGSGFDFADPNVGTVKVTDSKGEALSYIPFQVVGAENNDWSVDRPPMFDICSLNIGHYRNSADWEESCFVVGQPTPKVTGLTEDWYTRIMGKRINFGSRGGVPLPVGGDLDLVQANPNSMAAEGMKDKERRMLALGAKLLEQKQVQQTASEVRINYATELSVLGTISKNLASAYTTVLGWCGVFMGVTKPPKFEMGVDFDLGKLTSEELTAVAALFTGKLLSLSEARELLVKSGYAHLSLDEFNAEIAAQAPTYTVPLPNMPGVSRNQQQQQQQGAPAVETTPKA